MTYIQRTIEALLRKTIASGKSVLLLGARQTGKTTLLKHIGGATLFHTLLDPELRLQFERSPRQLGEEIRAHTLLHPSGAIPLVVMDEIQKVPPLMDAIQLLIDNQEAQFILTGSSVRKLRRHAQFNLLPGRVVNFFLDPLSIAEMSPSLPSIETLLLYGSLPGIYLENRTDVKQAVLEAYVKNYLEEEIRGEALVRQLGSFSRFLELAATEAGNQINTTKLSQDLGVSRYTIVEYFSLLEDCLIAEKIEPITQTVSRRKLTKAPKYIFFDMGIRRIAAREGTQLSSKRLGELFEQFIGLELMRMMRLKLPMMGLHYWRDHAGPEVDYVLEHNKQYIPIEVKWTQTPSLQDAKHLSVFIKAYPCVLPAYVICRCEKPLLLCDSVMALPWQMLPMVLERVGHSGESVNVTKKSSP